MANPSKDSPLAEQVKDMLTSDVAPAALKCAKASLGSSDARGGVLAWRNPETGPIIVVRLIIDRTASSSAVCTVDFGSASRGNRSSDNLIDGLDVNTANGVEDNIEHKGANGKSMQRLDAKGGRTDYIAGSKATGEAAGLAGHAYIFYVEV